MNLRNERLNCYKFNKIGAISFINSAGTKMFIYHDNFKHSKITIFTHLTHFQQFYSQVNTVNQKNCLYVDCINNIL